MKIAAIVIAAVLPVMAQETIKVHLVEVPVTVIDHDGNPIRGLKAENFELFDDGKRQKITAFDAIDFASTESVSAISPLNPNARRSFILVFDLEYSQHKSIPRARVAARKFVAANVLPHDLVAVAFIDPMKGFQLATAFTTDRNLVDAAIASPNLTVGVDPLQLSGLDSFGNSISGASASLATGIGGAMDEADSERNEIKARTAEQNRRFAALQLENHIHALEQLAMFLRSAPGRKQVIYLSGGFDGSIVIGRGARDTMAEEMAEMTNVISGNGHLPNLDARFGSPHELGNVKKTGELFKLSDVVINAIDIDGIGIEDGTPTGKPPTVYNDALHLLANPTGGTVFENTNDLHSDFERLMHEQEVVYVLSFQAQSSHPGRLHDLTVKAIDLPGVRVNNRVAYHEAGGEIPAERALTNAEIVMNDIPQRDIRVAAIASAVPGEKHSAVAFFLEINGHDLLAATTSAVPVHVFVYAFDEHGIVRDRVDQRIKVDPARASSAMRENGIKYFTTLALPPGHYAIRALVERPDPQKRGFVRTDLIVPEPGDASVSSPLFFDKPGQWALLKGVQRDDASYPFLLNGEPFVPSATPLLQRAARTEFALFLYNAAAEEMMIGATVTDSAGAKRPVEPTLVRQIQGDRVMKLVFEINSTGMSPGPATLELGLRKKGSSDILKTSLPVMCGFGTAGAGHSN
ncbi:MAG TPA: VWA domain-containing protein [Thermoanaerobaculia bacterium]|jgi:VWFA-related protein|nr:VWA domain-containing protein [Thermoanaerobaculia bacterium]